MTELRGKLPPGFDPSRIDSRLLRGGTNITLLGIASVNPQSELVANADEVLRAIREFLSVNPDAAAADVSDLTRLVDIPEKEVAEALYRLSFLGVFHNSGIIYGADAWKTINITEQAFAGFFTYETVGQLLKSMLDENEESLASPGAIDVYQKSESHHQLGSPKANAIGMPSHKRPDAIRARLHDLSDNIAQDYVLLKEYEDALRLEDDPRRRARYQREIDRLKTSATAYEREYEELEAQVAGRPLEASQNERSELRQIHVKLDALLAGQSDINLGLYNLRQAILSRYDAGERHIIDSITERLNQTQAETVQTILNAVEKNQLNEAEMAEAIGAIQQTLTEMRQRGAALPEHAELEETISAPHLDVKHKLKFSIPIVPLLLEYEGEVELGSGVNLESVWNRLADKFRRK